MRRQREANTREIALAARAAKDALAERLLSVPGIVGVGLTWATVHPEQPAAHDTNPWMILVLTDGRIIQGIPAFVQDPARHAGMSPLEFPVIIETRGRIVAYATRTAPAGDGICGGIAGFACPRGSSCDYDGHRTPQYPDQSGTCRTNPSGAAEWGSAEFGAGMMSSLAEGLCERDPAMCHLPGEPTPVRPLAVGSYVRNYAAGYRWTFRTRAQAQAWVAKQFPGHRIVDWWEQGIFDHGDGIPRAGDSYGRFLYADGRMVIITRSGHTIEILLRLEDPEPIV